MRALDQGWPISTTYGLTEASSQVATALPAAVRRKPLSVGRPLLFTQVRVLGEQGNDQPPGVYGEILVAGPTLMRGYLGSAQATSPELPKTAGTQVEQGSGDGGRDRSRGTAPGPAVAWHATGDIGYLDAEGDLFVVQRRSDLIISGGENIYPAEVEEVLRRYPGIVDVAVIGVDSQEWGQRVAAAIVATAPLPDTAAIERFCRERLAGFKVPRVMVFTSELPRTAAGKIQRSALIQLISGSKVASHA
jgi:O-succinylbenzoic acid--CoA ligase